MRFRDNYKTHSPGKIALLRPLASPVRAQGHFTCFALRRSTGPSRVSAATRKGLQNHRFFRAKQFCNCLFKLFLFLFLCTATLHARPGYFEPWGKDADLHHSDASSEPQPSHSLFVRMAEQVILFHQNVLSPVDGPRSHFRPSSSQYMLLAMRKYGFFEGFALGCDRLLRENSAEWVYQTIEEDGKLIKYDPVP